MRPRRSRATASRDGERTALLRAIRFVAERRRGVLFLLAALSFVSGLVEAAFLVMVSQIAFSLVDESRSLSLLGLGNVSLSVAIAIAFMLVLLKLCMAIASSSLGARLTSKTLVDVRRQLNRAFRDASWATQQRQSIGGFQELSLGYGSQASGLASSLSTFLGALLQLIAMLAIAFVVDAFGAVILIVTVAALSTVFRPVRRTVKRRSWARNDAGMSYASALSDTSRLGLELHVFHVQDEVATVLDGLNVNVGRTNRRADFASAMVAPLYAAAAYLALLVVVAVVAASDLADISTIGAVVLVMLRSLGYGQSVQTAYTKLGAQVPAVETFMQRIEDLDLGRRTDGIVKADRVGVIEFRGVSFAYPDGPNVLHSMSFQLEPNEIVGVVGPSGSGKSTLVQLLLGVREPDTGVVTADGVDLREVARSSWARKATFVPQAPHVVSGSVADNIRFFRSWVTEEEVERAARQAHLHDEIVAHPDGYERRVGEGGSHLSGGQMQRLCIARALVERPELLILDEPTSALDVKSEHLIRSTLHELGERMTVLVIAHRLSTLDICDRIMVIQDGELRAFDTPRALEMSSAFYREALELSGMR